MITCDLKKFRQELQRQYDELGERKKDLTDVSYNDRIKIYADRCALGIVLREVADEIWEAM